VGMTAVAVKGVAASFKMLTAKFIGVTAAAGASRRRFRLRMWWVQRPARKRSQCNKSNARLWDALSNGQTCTTQRMIEEMPNITELLSGLRQEISDLQNMNARYAGKRVHSEVEQAALELRTTRLREIKQELSKMLDRPQDAKVWWEKSRRSSGMAIGS
jgi:hypothetical protein